MHVSVIALPRDAAPWRSVAHHLPPRGGLRSGGDTPCGSEASGQFGEKIYAKLYVLSFQRHGTLRRMLLTTASFRALAHHPTGKTRIFPTNRREQMPGEWCKIPVSDQRGSP